MKNVLIAISARKDLLLVGLLVLIIFMMILPLPTLLMDVLISFNMTIAVLLLMVAIYLSSPLRFSTLPTVLLIATLFRLAISISTTRLILLQADAGEIVKTFGEFVVGGNLIVGLVVFLIITIVQFIVITKGAERVAEVGASFTLDGMPGKQMSIDADLKAGTIDLPTAQQRRLNLEKESQLFGAMDGAMKFVKGDAIAGLIITTVNILGGIAIGTSQLGMSMGEAVQVYSILTIGDGLVSQVPALFLSVASGTIVTRVSLSETSDLGTDIGQQLTDNTRAMQIAGFILLGFAAIPGFPTTIFLILGVGLMAGGHFSAKKQKRAENSHIDAWSEWARSQKTKSKRGGDFPAPVQLRMSAGIEAIVPPGQFQELIAERGVRFADETGIEFPQMDVRDDPELKGHTFQILIHHVAAAGGSVEPERILALSTRDDLDLLGIDPEEIIVDEFGYHWIEVVHQPEMERAGIRTLTVAEHLCRCVDSAVRADMAAFVGVQETQRLLEGIGKDFGQLVEEAKKAVPLPKITEVLKRLLAENVSIRHLRIVLDAMVEWGQKEKDAILLSEYIRSSLCRQISRQFADRHETLPAILLTPDVEEKFRECLRKTSVGSYLVIAPEESDAIVDQLTAILGERDDWQSLPVVLTPMDVRRHFKTLLEGAGIAIPVLSFQDIDDSVMVFPCGVVTSMAAS